MISTEGRHPGTQQIARWFTWDHLSAGLPKDVSANCQKLAQYMISELPDSPELTAGLRKLLEAKDCFVRSAIAAGDAKPARIQTLERDETGPWEPHTI